MSFLLARLEFSGLVITEHGDREAADVAYQAHRKSEARACTCAAMLFVEEKPGAADFARKWREDREVDASNHRCSGA